jgi:hypothetical protein
VYAAIAALHEDGCTGLVIGVPRRKSVRRPREALDQLRRLAGRIHREP